MPADAWDALDAYKYQDEAEAVAGLLAAHGLAPEERARIGADAEELVQAARGAANRQGVVESFLQQFSLSTKEGLALMCLAEALLRTPDQDTRDKLIAEKIGSADWATHLGKSPNLFVNASTWGLMLTGKLVQPDAEAERDVGAFVKRVAGRVGEPVIRQAMGVAIRIMGEQFVLGRDIDSAVRRAQREGWLCSFDMLGEGARTAADAQRYEDAYAHAVETVGRSSGGEGPETGHGVSVKLSALSPRYEAVQEERVWAEVYPRLKRLACIAAEHDVNLAIDAEEADRLVLSLRLLERLTREPELGDWTGRGLAVQAYQKRAPFVIDAVAKLARDSGRRLMVRLVKGAYWDSEIKRAQIAGRPGYPVFTRKANTDLSYLVCAKKLIEASPHLYGQFATHNAHTLAAIKRMAERNGVHVEFQRLHGMGEALYDAAAARSNCLTLRAYAPVGGHEDLLPYLVRRLLENGANTSFVHALLDEKVPASDVVSDPIDSVEARPGPHPRIPLPVDLYGESRKNSMGRDLTIRAERERLLSELRRLDGHRIDAGPLVEGRLRAGEGAQTMRSPSDRNRVIGSAAESAKADIDAAFTAARAAQPAWDARTGRGRGAVLRKVGDLIERDGDRLMALLSREAGKSWLDAIAEVREAADFCRYYARLAERDFSEAEVLTGPAGETNTLSLHGRGVFVCISPWNFPLAIFTGQIAASLAAGNAVLAKAAEQTPLIAHETVKLFFEAGLDPRLLALLPGRGETVGAALTGDDRLDGVAFTGGTETAWAINGALAKRRGPLAPFIAETGGLNGMFVDSTALREQVIDDVIVSAFGTAGQRCSALRVLFLPRASADSVIEGLSGAMDALVLGDPADPSVDVGPVIDEDAREGLQKHLERLEREAKVIKRLEAPVGGVFFGPVLAEIPSADWLEREVFGPVLHVVRYDPERLEDVARSLASRQYGLTLGVHTRIDSFSDTVRRLVPAGNVYVNRSIIGAVVGVQPFGGEKLSGTGPKAGGPLALTRYATERALSVNIAAQGGDPALLNLGSGL